MLRQTILGFEEVENEGFSNIIHIHGHKLFGGKKFVV